MRAHVRRWVRLTLVSVVGLTGASVTAQSGTAPTVDPMLQSLRWRNIGNANLIGRISSVDALESDWTHVVVGSASGGVWKSLNGGTSWTTIFDNYGSASIGDVRINQQNPQIIWVGTGEECGRNSAAWGDGIYKSIDGGATFTNVGLKDSYNIAEIVLHPKNQDLVYVAAIGNIYQGGGSRGVFKTIDGGKTWTKLTEGLPNDPQTGAIDLVMDPSNPEILYTAFWQRIRYPWALKSGGPHSGIFKSVNGGKTWTKLTKGLPPGDLGRSGLAVARSNPRVLMAHIEHGYQPNCGGGRGGGGRGGRGGDPQPATPPTPNPDCDMSKLGAGMYRSEDGGASWVFLDRTISRPFYYMHVAISPLDDKYIFSFNINYRTSRDGGKTWQGGGPGGGHCYHAMWHDPHNKGRYYIGSDGGLNLTHDDLQTDLRFNNINVTQYYDVGLTMAEPYWVCGGLQDAGSSCGPSQTRAQAIYTSDWVNLSGGDGYHAESPPDNPDLVITESQPGNSGGNIGYSNLRTRERTSMRPNKNTISNWNDYITPEMEKTAADRNWGQQPQQLGALRFNWSTPIKLSPHNTRTVYTGANHLLMSTDFGRTWRVISPDLTTNDPEKTVRRSGGMTPDEDPGGGAEYHSTIITISESPLEPGNIWIGTDDGNVQVTRDGGKTWTKVGIAGMPDMPRADFWVSRVEAGHHARGTAYVTVTGHRMANYDPFVYKTTDYGKTWTKITSGIPTGIPGNPMYVIKEDPVNPNLLFAGSEFTAFYSLDAGQTWKRLNDVGGPRDRSMPTVAVHDVEIHARDYDLVAGTHGRGLWILDDITPLQQMTTAVQQSEAHLFRNRPTVQWMSVQPQHGGGALAFRGQNPTRNAVINFYVSSKVSGDVRFEVSSADGLNTCAATLQPGAAGYTPGIGRLEWTMRWSSGPGAAAAGGGGRGGGGGGGGGRGAGAAGGGTPPACLIPVSAIAPPAGGRGGGGGGGRGGGGGAAQVEPGTYKVTMTANGKTYTSTVTLRPDPMER
jgi:photosystem II stability/assembly factor-like uncharacterized protein